MTVTRTQTDWASADWSEVEKMIKDITTIRSRLKPAMTRATRKSAVRVRDDARVRIKAITTGRTTYKYPSTITYDLTKANGVEVVAEIGPDRHIKGKQGFLGHLLENGTVKSPPKPHLVPALVAETDHYEAAMADEAEKVTLP